MPQQFTPPISTSNLYAPDLDRVFALIDLVTDDDGAIVIGSLVTKLEEKLCEYHECSYCVTFSTGFWALVAAVRIRALPDRSQVIIPSLTYRRLADAVYWSEKVPVFVDVEPDLAVCPDAVAEAFSDETSLILAVHPIVNCCDVHRLVSISEERDVPIVFDAVESVHETIRAQRVGSFGIGEVFSLHASKLINGMEGGYVCTNDQDFAQRLIQFRNGGLPSDNGRADHNDRNYLGVNGVLNDGHAALALAGLEEIASNVQHNKTIYETYLSELQAVRGIDILRFSDVEQTSYKNVVAEVTDDFPLGRDELVQLLNSDGILARAYYTPALHSKTYDYRVKTMEMQVTPHAARRFINLPCGQRVSPADVASVCWCLSSIAAAHQGKVSVR